MIDFLKTQMDWWRVEQSFDALQLVIAPHIKLGWEIHDSGACWVGKTPQGWVYASFSSDPRPVMKQLLEQ